MNIDFWNFNLDKGYPPKHLTLTGEKAYKLIKAAHSNADSLIKDGLILLKSDSKSRAVTLFIMAIEEIGKIIVIMEILVTPDSKKENLKTLWKNFSDHKTKNKVWLYPLLHKMNAKFSEVLTITERSSQAIKFFSDLKNASLYIDIDDQGVIHIPKQIDDFTVSMVFTSAIDVINNFTIFPQEYYVEKKRFFIDEGKDDMVLFYQRIYQMDIINQEMYDSIITNYSNIND